MGAADTALIGGRGVEPPWIVGREQRRSSRLIDWVRRVGETEVRERHQGRDICVIHEIDASISIDFVGVDLCACGTRVYDGVVLDGRSN